MLGCYICFGDVLLLFVEEDDYFVVMVVGDEFCFCFVVDGLFEVLDGYRCWVFFESFGWDKDVDCNIFEVMSV